ncbi:MAG: di/tricarboxylate transporter [Chlamydiales bacterium]|jgi:di/tricarboxylate transporter
MVVRDYQKRIYIFIFLLALGGFTAFSLDSSEVLSTLSPTASLNSLDWRGWLTISLFLLVFYSLVKEYLPPDITMLLGAGVLVLFGVIHPEDFLKGFSQDIIITLAMLFIIARALEMNGILNLVAKRALPQEKKPLPQLLKMMIPLSVASAFLNNTPIVLMLTPVIRKWALEKGMSPSKFLIPLSYATILGGSCTLIGTSCNLVVDGMLRAVSPDGGLGFFELSYIGIPICITGFLYMYLFGYRLLPERVDVTTAVLEQTREFTTEFLVTGDCVLHDKTIEEAGAKYFKGENLVEIERGTVIIDSPGRNDKIYSGDRLVFAGDIETIAELHAIEGLHSLADFHFKLDINSSHFAEVVIATTSSLIGKTLRRVGFRRYYGASVLAVYRQGKRVQGNVGEVVLQAGDTLMLLSGKPWEPGSIYNNDFYYIKYSEKLPLFHPLQGSLVAGILIAMVVAATLGVPMMSASFAAAVAMLVTRSISIREARNSIRLNLLILIGSAFAFGNALQTTGVASFIAKAILVVVGQNEYLLVAAIFGTTLVITEMVTNNAAALLIFPIAIEIARLAGFDSPEAMKTIAVTVAIAASCSFATPIGYQTNTIVYGPGGYKFTDYCRVGIPLSFLMWILGIILIPLFWPLSG